MIIKGGSRAGPKQLAAHLGRTDTNERVVLLEVHSGIDDLAATFRDWQTLAEGTRGTKGLYHVNIDPDARYTMSPDQWARAVDVLEQELGFDGQPRAVVMHEKKGRQHIHVVWARTDAETMKMRSDSNNYAAHERASQALEQEFGHAPVPGKHAKRDREKQPEPPKAAITHAEWQQAERSGISIADRRASIAALYSASDSGAAFKAGLEDEGYVLAQGDRRDFVLVDMTGETFSLGRQIKGVKAAELRDFMADVDRDALPNVAEATALQQARLASSDAPAFEMQRPPLEEIDPALAPSGADAPTAARAGLDPVVAEALAARQQATADKLAEWHLAETRQFEHVLSVEMEEKFKALSGQHEAERERFARAQRAATSGIDRFIEALKNRLNPGRGAENLKLRRAEWRQLHARQDRERADMKVLLEQNQIEQVEELRERHAQQQREQAVEFEREHRRYTEDAARAQQLRQQIEEDRREAERRAQEGLGPDGPPRLTK
jgi:hypothetical protein